MGLRGRANLTEEYFFFVTTTVVSFTKVFVKDIYFEILIRNIKHYQGKYKFSILAYVIMPSHFHWIVEVNPEFGTISDIMRDIKKYSAWDLMDAIQENDPEVTNIFHEHAFNFPKQKRKFWINRFDDEVLRNEKMFRTKLHYIHNNLVEEGLAIKPENYKYSSARNYVYNDHSILEVDTSFAGIEMK